MGRQMSRTNVGRSVPGGKASEKSGKKVEKIAGFCGGSSYTRSASQCRGEIVLQGRGKQKKAREEGGEAGE